MKNTNPNKDYCDNQPYDPRAVVIYDDFAACSDGKWFRNFATKIDYSEKSFRFYILNAQEIVEDAIYRMINNEYYR